MPVLAPAYSVVLRGNIPPAERELLSHFSHELVSSTGETLLHIQCTKIDLSHQIYIEMESFRSGDTETHPIRIPHHFVVLISGDEARPTIGFLPDQL